MQKCTQIIVIFRSVLYHGLYQMWYDVMFCCYGRSKMKFKKMPKVEIRHAVDLALAETVRGNILDKIVNELWVNNS